MALIPTPPIHKLPDELLREIFSIICTGSMDVSHRFGGLWILLQACARWRGVAQDTATLWTEIIIFNDNTETYTPPAALERTQLCLKFSKKLPLDVTLIIPPDSAGDATIFRDIVLALIPHVGRWKTLCLNEASFSLIEGRNDTHRASQTSIQPGQLKDLQTFIYDDEDCGFLDYKMFLGADALEIVELRGFSLATALEFPWANLKRLVVRECTIFGEPGTGQGFNIRKFFKSLSRLEELVWELNDEVFNPVSSVVTFPYLRHIAIDDSSELARIMPMLRFPSLAQLEVTSYSYFDTEISPALNTAQILSMLKDSVDPTSKCRIKILKLALDVIDTKELIQILRVAQDIEQLSLSLSTAQTTEILEDLRSQSSPTSLLPCLQRVDFETPWTADSKEAFDSYVNCMMHIIRSKDRPADLPLPDDQHGRWPKGKLRHIRSCISVKPDMVDHCRAEIRKLEEVGIRHGVKVDFDCYEMDEVDETDETDDSA